MATCSVIIRSYNEEKHISKLIAGLKRQKNFHDLEIILVDSGSKDKTVSIALQSNIKVINIKSADFSFGRALNIGSSVATGDYLLFASAHVYPLYTDWIECLLRPFEDEKVALVYGKQVGNENTKYSEHRLFTKWFPSESNYDQTTPFCNNANAVIKRTLWEQQHYDEFLTGLEDLDWANKIQFKGYKIAYEANATIVHVHEETITKIKNRYQREAIALKKIIPSQHLSFLGFMRLSLSNIISDWVHAFYHKRFFKEFVSIVQFRSMQFWGTYQGYKQVGDIGEKLRRRFYYPNEIKIKSSINNESRELINYILM